MKIKTLLNDKVITLSNFLSFSRILIVPLILFFLFSEKQTGETKYIYYILICYGFIGFSDFFDGFFARLLKQQSRLGQFLDPLADKIATLSITGALSYYKNFPLWLWLAILGREIIFIFSAFSLFSKKDIEVSPNIFGKIGITVISLVIILYTISFSEVWHGFELRKIAVFFIFFFFALSAFVSFKTYFRSSLEKKEPS